MKFYLKKSSVRKDSLGSALILAVVLSSLLAIVGVLFVLAARVNSMATSAIEENKDLELAVESIVAKISNQLVLDVPGVFDPNGDPNSVYGLNQEYYDFPDANNLWLADLEPYLSESDGKYYWRQISDITGYITQRGWRNQNIEITDGTNDKLLHAVKAESEIIEVLNGDLLEQLADADGDGIADSKWLELGEINSSKGRPIYAAVRVIDNSAMLNVNTAYKFEFDPCDPNTFGDIDGSSQVQINLMALAGRPGFPPDSEDETNLLIARTNTVLGVDTEDLLSYEQYYIWNFNEQSGLYTPFDISDELELRYRFLLNHEQIDTRLENWGGEFRNNNTISTPVTSGGEDLDKWYLRTCGGFDTNYAYRHIATTYNMDRIINPAGFVHNGKMVRKMVNINTAAPDLLYDAIYTSLIDNEPNHTLVEQLAGQLTANIIDLRVEDSRYEDSKITVFQRYPTSEKYYGFEAQPFISDIAFYIKDTGADSVFNNYFVVELFNPFDVDIPLDEFRLMLRNKDGTKVKIMDLDVEKGENVISEGGRCIMTNGPFASSMFFVSDFGCLIEDSNLVLAEYSSLETNPPTYELEDRYDVYLIRETDDVNIYLDKQVTADNWFDWDDVKENRRFYYRSDNNLNVIYQDMSGSKNDVDTLTKENGLLGLRQNYNFVNVNTISSFGFTNIGEIDRVLTIAPSDDPNDMLGVRLALEPPESNIRIDVDNPAFEGIFQYLTVIDPTMHGNPPQETRIKGRININTAPWFVMYQLPWVDYELAQAIVAYRDKLLLLPGVVDYSGGRARGMWGLSSEPTPISIREDPGFASIIELLNVTHSLSSTDSYYDPRFDIRRYGCDKDLNGNNVDQLILPDLTFADGAANDLEERNIIFTRISNLVTVRSDVFTAYILVRIGVDGPQKRMIAVFDRSEVNSLDDKVRIIALHPVPDPR